MNLVSYITITSIVLGAAKCGQVNDDSIRKVSNTSFTQIGTISDPNQRNGRIDVFLSDHAMTQNEAMVECGLYYSGRLLSIFTEDQDKEIETLLHARRIFGIHIWTSGQFDYNSKEFYWSSVNRPLIYTGKWLHDDCFNPEINTQQGITLYRTSRYYGWCIHCETSNSNRRHRFICTV